MRRHVFFFFFDDALTQEARDWLRDEFPTHGPSYVIGPERGKGAGRGGLSTWNSKHCVVSSRLAVSLRGEEDNSEL